MNQIQVPKGWEINTMEKICLAIQPGFAEGQKDVPNGVIHLRMNNISTDFKLNFDLIRTIKPTKEQIEKYALKKNDIVFNNTNSTTLVGKSALFDKDGTFLYSNHLTRLRANYRIVLPQWILLYVRYLWHQQYFERNCNKWVNQAAFNNEKIKNLEIPIPPLEIQKKIIQKLDRILGQLEEKKKEVLSFKNYKKLENYDALLIQQIYDNVFSKIAKNWIKKPLGDITIKSQNGRTGRPNDAPPGIPRLGITSVTQSYTGFIDESKCKFQEISDSEIDLYQVHKGDLLVCRQNGNKSFVGKFSIYSGNTIPLIFSDSLIRFQIQTNEIIPEFLMMFMNSSKGRNKIEPYCKTTAGNYSINGTNLKKIEIYFPPIEEQKKLIQIKTHNLQKIEHTKNQIIKFLNLKEKTLFTIENLQNSILNQAFSGKLVN